MIKILSLSSALFLNVCLANASDFNFLLDSLETEEAWKEYISTLDSLIAQKPKNKKLKERKAQYLVQNQNFKLALKLIRTDSLNSPNGKFLEATALLQLDSLDHAQEIVNLLDSTSIPVLLIHCRILTLKKQYRTALNKINEHLELHPFNPALLFQLSETLHAMSHPFAFYIDIFSLNFAENDKDSQIKLFGVLHFLGINNPKQTNPDQIASFIQNHILKLIDRPKNATWQKPYIHFFRQLKESGYLPYFSYFIQRTLNDQALIEWLLQNSEKLEPFYDWMNHKLQPLNSEVDIPISANNPKILP